MGLIERNFAREMKFIQMMEEAEAPEKRRRTGGSKKKTRNQANDVGSPCFCIGVANMMT